MEVVNKDVYAEYVVDFKKKDITFYDACTKDKYKKCSEMTDKEIYVSYVDLMIEKISMLFITFMCFWAGFLLVIVGLTNSIIPFSLYVFLVLSITFISITASMGEVLFNLSRMNSEDIVTDTKERVDYMVNKMTRSIVTVENLKDKVYVLPYKFKNELLEYKMFGDYKKYKDKLVVEHYQEPLKKRMWPFKKLYKNDDESIWQARFYFDEVPKKGRMVLEFV